MRLKVAPIIAVMLASPFLAISCTHVDAGNVGVEVNSCSNGGVVKEPVGVGYHGVGPCTTIVEFPVFQQTLLLDGDNQLKLTSSEGLPIDVDSSLSFTVDGQRAPHIYEKYRKDLEAIEHSYFKQAVREAGQEIFAKYTAQQLYSDKKEVARREIEVALKTKLSADGFEVQQFTINRAQVPGEVLQAIQAKVAQTQQAQQAQQKVAQAEAEGRQRVATAEAEASATRLKADAEAYANQKITSSITPTLVQYKLAGKWDGKLSTYTGNGASFFLQGK